MIELPPPGLGVLNYDLYLKRLAQKHPNIPIIIEHLDESDVPRAKEFIDGRLVLDTDHPETWSDFEIGLEVSP